MADFHLYELDDGQFEQLVVQICRDWLGESVQSFSPGVDGGRDSKFIGTANSWPSKASPLSGKFIIQAKATSEQLSSCSQSRFRAIVKEEIPSIAKLIDNGELDYYLLFTNRKKPAGAEAEITELIRRETRVREIWLIGREDIESYLQTNPELVKHLKLDTLRSPLRIRPDDLEEVIREFHANQSIIANGIRSMYNFAHYPGIDRKNIVNGLTEEYFQHIQRRSAPYFHEIDVFLGNLRNTELREMYHTCADELQGQIILHRKRFNSFDELFEELYHLIVDACPKLMKIRRLASVFLHYMYCSCDIGNQDDDHSKQAS